MEGIFPLVALNIILISQGISPRIAKTIMSILNASFLSGMGLVFLYIWQLIPQFQPEYLLTTEPEQTWLADYIATYFMVDMALGAIFGDINILTGYVHHSVYIAILMYLRQMNHSNLIFLALPFEIPTAVLDYHRLYPAEQYALAFVSTFIGFRVLWNMYLIKLMYNYNTLYTQITCLMLTTHLYWLAEWTSKQLNRTKQ